MAQQENNTSKSSATKVSWKKSFIDNFLSLGLALILVLAIRSSVIEAFKIPSGSMIPTLLVGDHIFVNKFAYGFKVPYTDWFMEEPIYITSISHPKNGDIVVFNYPGDPSIYYIKRVIGVPGDKIEMKEKRLYINGTPVEQTPVSAEESDKLLADLKGTKYDLPSFKVFREKYQTSNPTIIYDEENYNISEMGTRTVPEGFFFVMGDNRDYSNDSRFWGFVPMKYVKGKALVVWFSVWLPFLNFNSMVEDHPFSFKPWRIGTILN